MIFLADHYRYPKHVSTATAVIISGLLQSIVDQVTSNQFISIGLVGLIDLVVFVYTYLLSSQRLVLEQSKNRGITYHYWIHTFKLFPDSLVVETVSLYLILWFDL